MVGMYFYQFFSSVIPEGNSIFDKFKIALIVAIVVMSLNMFVLTFISALILGMEKNKEMDDELIPRRTSGTTTKPK